MGMIANYKLVNENELERMRELVEGGKASDLMGYIETLQEKEETEILDIDKMWDVMHFIFTGIDSMNPIDDNPLSEAVVGQHVIGEEDFISVTESQRAGVIVEALENFDIDTALANFSMEECKNAELYPDIWDYEDEADDIKEEIKDYYDEFIKLYKTAVKGNMSVVVTIY